MTLGTSTRSRIYHAYQNFINGNVSLVMLAVLGTLFLIILILNLLIPGDGEYARLSLTGAIITTLALSLAGGLLTAAIIYYSAKEDNGRVSQDERNGLFIMVSIVFLIYSTLLLLGALIGTKTFFFFLMLLGTITIFLAGIAFMFSKTLQGFDGKGKTAGRGTTLKQVLQIAVLIFVILLILAGIDSMFLKGKIDRMLGGDGKEFTIKSTEPAHKPTPYEPFGGRCKAKEKRSKKRGVIVVMETPTVSITVPREANYSVPDTTSSETAPPPTKRKGMIPKD